MIGLGARATAVGATMRLSVPAVAYPGRHDRLLGIMVSGGMTPTTDEVEIFLGLPTWPAEIFCVHTHGAGMGKAKSAGKAAAKAAKKAKQEKVGMPILIRSAG